jgi:hypothetical protein
LTGRASSSQYPARRRSVAAAQARAIYGSGKLSWSAYSVLVRSSCGRALVGNSLIVDVGPRQTHPPHCYACVSTLFFLDRRGRALSYYLY